MDFRLSLPAGSLLHKQGSGEKIRFRVENYAGLSIIPSALVVLLCVSFLGPRVITFCPPTFILGNPLVSILHIACVQYHPRFGIAITGYLVIRILQELAKF